MPELIKFKISKGVKRLLNLICLILILFMSLVQNINSIAVTNQSNKRLQFLNSNLNSQLEDTILTKDRKVNQEIEKQIDLGNVIPSFAGARLENTKDIKDAEMHEKDLETKERSQDRKVLSIIGG